MKVIGEKEVLVEGQIEKKKEGEEGNSFSQKFSRRFLLPENTKVEDITSVMSADGILTITAPKKVVSQESVKILENKGASLTGTSQSSNTTAAQSSQESSEEAAKHSKTEEKSNCERYCENCYKKLQSEKKTSEESTQQKRIKIPIKINASVTKNNETSQTQKAQTNLESKSISQNMKSTTSLNSQSDSSEVLKDKSRLSETNPSFENNDKRNSVAVDVKINSEDKGEISRNIPISANFSPLPITRRGLFFNDSIFEDARHDFQTAVRDILSKWGERSSILDDLTCYRNLRTRDLREENQAVKVSEGESNHKVRENSLISF